MDTRDPIRATNQRHWERMVVEGCGFTVPWLDLDPALVRRLARGELDPVPAPLLELYPVNLLSDLEGKDILCLASGGGQQSAVFGLLGARVTVMDLAEGQLQGDRTAAEHYGYLVTTIQADMRDLSILSSSSFDLVYQAPSMCYVPDARAVYAQVARLLRPGGRYRVTFTPPDTQFVDFDSWEGGGYRISVPYSQRALGPSGPNGEGSVQFRHYMADIFNGLIELGLTILQVQDDPQYFLPENLQAQPGTWAHSLAFLGQFAIVAQRQ